MLLYQRIKDQIRSDLQEKLQRAAVVRVPSQRDLESTYRASRQTIGKALAELVAEGFLRRDGQRGPLVADRDPLSRAEQAGPARRIGFVAPFTGSLLSQRTLRGISRVAQRRGYHVLLSCSGDGRMDQEEAGARELISAGARGLIITPAPRRPGETEVDYLCRMDLGAPVVLTDIALPEHGRTQVLFDNEGLVCRIVRWLFALGHRRIGLIGEPLGWSHPTLAARRRGYLAAHADAGVEVDSDLMRPYCGVEHESLIIGQHIAEWFASPVPPTAIIAEEDVGAIETIDELAAIGLKSPDDVVVIGFDHLVEARRLAAPFPTTDPNFERLGEIACEALIDEMETGRSCARSYMLEVPLLMRGIPERDMRCKQRTGAEAARSNHLRSGSAALPGRVEAEAELRI